MTYKELKNSYEDILKEPSNIYTPKGWWWKRHFKKYQLEKYLAESLITHLWMKKHMDGMLESLPYEFVKEFIPERLNDWIRLKKLKYGIVGR